MLGSLAAQDGSAMFVLPQLSYKAVGTVTALLTFVRRCGLYGTFAY
jgi:hypothetical protein